MRRTRRRCANVAAIDRRWLFGMVALLVIITVTVNCNLGHDNSILTETTAAAIDSTSDESQKELMPLADNSAFGTDDLWADVTDTITSPRQAQTSPSYISLDVVDANLIDVLSLLAYKLGVNIIFLGEPTKITLKIENLSPLTVFQLILQKEGLDYLSIGQNYIVAEVGILDANFSNRMMLSRYNLFYVSAEKMKEYLETLGGVPETILTVDSNQAALWIQGTPMTLARARTLINSLDIMENADFNGARAAGGSRHIRLPVAMARGPLAEEELEALIDLLSILLDGYRDGRVDMDWVTWDHPDPVPYIYMDWENPIIKPYDIKMKITRDFADDYNSQIRYLIAEGTPDNIELVNQMINEIQSTTLSPIRLEGRPEQNQTVNFVPITPESASLPAYMVTLRAVPAEGGTLSGGGAFVQGTSVTVIASSNEGYQFLRWIENGYEMSTSKIYTFNIYSDRNLEAVFIRNNSDADQTSGNDENASLASD